MASRHCQKPIDLYRLKKTSTIIELEKLCGQFWKCMVELQKLYGQF